jgi:hypothetical protein
MEKNIRNLKWSCMYWLYKTMNYATEHAVVSVPLFLQVCWLNHYLQHRMLKLLECFFVLQTSECQVDVAQNAINVALLSTIVLLVHHWKALSCPWDPLIFGNTVYYRTKRTHTEQSRHILHDNVGRPACDFPVNKYTQKLHHSLKYSLIKLWYIYSHKPEGRTRPWSWLSL